MLITIEEGSVGGFGSFVLQYLAGDGLLDRGLKVRPMVLPDIFIDHDKPEKMYETAGLNAAGHRRDGAGDARPRRKPGRAGRARLNCVIHSFPQNSGRRHFAAGIVDGPAPSLA